MDASGPVRVAVIGAGRMGRAHLRALADTSGIAATAVVEPIASIRDEVRSQGVAGYAELDELLAAGGIDAALVAAPTDRHLELVEALAAAGLPIFCEKPCGRRPEETAEAGRIASEAGVPLQVGYWRRFVPALIDLRDQLSRGELGEIAQIWCWQWDEKPPSAEFRKRSGGILLDMGVHEFDQTRWLTGQEFIEIAAFTARVTSEIPVPGDPESVVAAAELSGGAVATVSLGRRLTAGEGCWVEIVGTEGHARSTFVWGDTGASVIHAALVAELEAFAVLVRGGEHQGATGDDALRAIEVAERAAGTIPVGAET